MSAVILFFRPAEPPVAAETTLDEALREYAYQCLAAAFGGKFATACQAFACCDDDDEAAELIAEIEAMP